MTKWKSLRSRSRLKGGGGIRLTSMMDILTTLLFYLLWTYAHAGEVVAPAPGVHLPASSSEEPPEASLVVAVSQSSILVAGEEVAHASAVLASDSLVIPELRARLERARAQREEIAELRGEEAAPLSVILQGDRDIEFALLEKVMATLSASGYPAITLAVTEGS